MSRNLLPSGSEIIRCMKCDKFIPFRSLAEHNALKHNVKDEFSDTDSDSLTSLFLSPPVSPPVSLPHLIRMDPSKEDKIRSIESFSNDNPNENGKFALNSKQPNDDSGLSLNDITNISQLTSKAKPRPMPMSSVRTATDIFHAEPANDTETARRRPTAFELLNGFRPRSGSCAPKMTFGQNTSIGSGEKIGLPRRSASVSRAQMKSDIEMQCPFCFNFMPKSSLDEHIQNKHASRIGAPLNGQPKGRAKVNGNRDNFDHCKLCNSYMFIDAIPGHMVRKHWPDQPNSIGINFMQFDDDVMNKWIQQRRIYVKDGIFFIKKN